MIFKKPLSFLFVFFSLLSLSTEVHAQENKSDTKNISSLKTTDFMAVKASLEEMLVRRYTQDLSSKIESKEFNIGANFDLIHVQQKRDQGEPLYNDLELSHLNADELYENYIAQFTNPEDKYLIENIAVNIGLDPNLNEEIKSEVETWISARLQKEFGDIAQFNVDYLKQVEVVEEPPPKLPEPYTLEWIKDFQLLTAAIIIALALLLGLLLSGLFSMAKGAISSASKNMGTNSSPKVNIESQAELKAQETDNKESDYSKKESMQAEIQSLKSQIKELAHKLDHELDSLITQWCEKGEEGLYRLATFAETASSIVGTLPIPEEHRKTMGKFFSHMHELDLEERLRILQQTYWDIISVVNLGADTLKEPFAFMSSANNETINKALMANNIETQTVVTMYMPEQARKEYLKDLDEETKIELLNKAAQLSSVTEDYLKSVEEQYAPYFKEKTEESEISMSLTLSKLVDSLNVLEACKVLPQVQGPVAHKFKLMTPHLAFVPEWSEESLKYLIKRLNNEQLLAYIRVVPDMEDVILENISSRSKQILQDDLAQPDALTEQQKEEALSSINSKIKELVNQGNVDLKEAIPNNNDKDIKIAA